MELRKDDQDFELLNKELNDKTKLEEYKKPYDEYEVSFLPKILGSFLILIGNLVYGFKPSYLKFRSIEVIARVPYHSWASATYTLLTMFYRDEHRAMKLSNVAKHAVISQDNETMHVVVISHLALLEKRAGVIRHTFIPMVFAFFYFWASYILYLLNPRWSFELNYIFEQHAFEQYDLFIEINREKLLAKPAKSDFLSWYGRDAKNQYEFFLSVRNDEIIHRNQSILEIEKIREAK